MLQLNVDQMTSTIKNSDDFLIAGRVNSYQGVIRAVINARIGELCTIVCSPRESVLAEVIGFESDVALLLPLRQMGNLKSNAEIISLGRRISVPVGLDLQGRTLDGLCRPIDGLGSIFPTDWVTPRLQSPSPLERPKINQVFSTGQKAIDGLLTFGKGQRVGLFAGSGVGKSTLVGEIAKYSTADVNVVALVGERGREVKPFIQDYLGADGLARSVVIVATADETPLLRIHAAKAAIAMSSWLRRQGKHVLLMIDSLTRLANAQREIGLFLGEPPSSRGYPPSALNLMAQLMEPLGCHGQGSVTGLLSVLVEGDDVSEPVADTVRSVIDGHIVLDRELAEKNHYPAINLSRSISRLVDSVTDETQLEAIQKIRSILSTYDEVADLIRIGMYQQGSSEKIDTAIHLREAVNQFLRQSQGQFFSFEETKQQLCAIAAAWPY